MSQSFAEAVGWVPKSRNLAATLARASHYAKAEAHPAVMLEHVLLALISDADAAAVLQACQLDVARLNAQLTGFLGGFQDRQRQASDAEPGASPDVIRILEYASAAAQQSRRREINGAIVLAAIVGDARSQAAAMLREQGLTFEETIKALQRANAGAARAPAPEPAAAPQPSPAPPPAPAGTHGVNGANGQSTEEILATARRRVDAGRAGSVTAPPHAPAGGPAQAHQPREPQLPALPPEPAPRSIDDLMAEEQERREREFRERERREREQPPAPVQAPPQPARHYPGSEQGHPPPRPAPPAPPAREAGQPPPPAYPQAAVPRPLPPQQHAPQPIAAPHRPEPPHHGHAPHPPSASHPQHPRGRAGVNAQASVLPNKARDARHNAAVSAGQLVENIPRSMKVGRPETVEVRIAKADVQALAEGLQGAGAAYRHDLVVTKAMAVRLRAPDGGFWIETASPETQWIENGLGPLSDEFASWRWTITPQRRGRSRLHLVVSARTVGSDGLVAETALPDRVITVKVRINLGQTAAHIGGWIAAAVAGGFLAKFGEGFWQLGRSLLDRIGGA